MKILVKFVLRGRVALVTDVGVADFFVFIIVVVAGFFTLFWGFAVRWAC